MMLINIKIMIWLLFPLGFEIMIQRLFWLILLRQKIAFFSSLVTTGFCSNFSLWAKSFSAQLNLLSDHIPRLAQYISYKFTNIFFSRAGGSVATLTTLLGSTAKPKYLWGNPKIIYESAPSTTFNISQKDFSPNISNYFKLRKFIYLYLIICFVLHILLHEIPWHVHHPTQQSGQTNSSPTWPETSCSQLLSWCLVTWQRSTFGRICLTIQNIQFIAPHIESRGCQFSAKRPFIWLCGASILFFFSQFTIFHK